MTPRSTSLALACLFGSLLTSCDQNDLHAKAIKDNGEQIERLRANISKKSLALKKLKKLNQDIAQADSKLITMKKAVQTSSSASTSLKNALTTETTLFETYVNSYRQMAWQNAVGEKYAELKNLNGKLYKNAKIKQITPVGMEITHDDGLARIRHTDLDQSFHERFQWKADEAQNILKKESLASAYMAKMTAKAAPPVDVQPAKAQTRLADHMSYTLPPMESAPSALNSKTGYKLNQKRRLATYETARIRVNRRSNRSSRSTIYYYQPQQRNNSNYNCPAPQRPSRPVSRPTTSYANPSNIIRR